MSFDVYVLAQKPLTPMQERRILARWKLWEPLVSLLRGEQVPELYRQSSMTWKQMHRRHVLVALQRGVTLSSISDLDIDDPRISEEARDERIASALEKRFPTKKKRKK